MITLLRNEYLAKAVIILIALFGIWYRYDNRAYVGSDILVGLEILFYLSVIFVYIVRKPAVQYSSSIYEYGIPVLVMVFLTMHSLLPSTRGDLFPYAMPFIALGLIVQIVALVTIRKSFSIFIEVRELITSGIYKYVRHPFYFGTFISVIGLFILRVSWFAFLFLALITIWQVYRAKLEERKLISAFPEYLDYQQRTAFMVPFLKIKMTLPTQTPAKSSVGSVPAPNKKTTADISDTINKQLTNQNNHEEDISR